MYIGKVSELTGATRKAIRHYESIGILATPARSGSYRFYSEHDLSVIRMIKRAQLLGFSLAELKELATRKKADRQLPLDLVSAMIDAKVTELSAQAEELQAKARALEQFKSEVHLHFA